MQIYYFISLFYTTAWLKLVEKHAIYYITKWWCQHNIILFSLEYLLTSFMEIGDLFYFSIEERLSSSIVVGSFSYYPILAPIFSTTIIYATSNNF